jgi:hypothetical protein
MVSPCSAWLPWEKFSRTMSTPAARTLDNIGSRLDAGPRVATIRVLRADCERAIGGSYVLKDDSVSIAEMRW